MNVDIYSRYSKQLREKKLNEFLPVLGAIAKGVGAVAKGAMNILAPGQKQVPGGGQQPAQQATFAQQSIDQMLVQDVDNILQKAQGNKSAYAQSVVTALNQLEDDAGKETQEKQQQQQAAAAKQQQPQQKQVKK
jgi:hypothetical protein